MTKKILIVEDEAIIALSEAKQIQKYGFEIVTAYSGEAAVEAIKADSSIALILMDIDLGNGMDGTEAAQQILSIRDIPIVFLTSHTEEEYVNMVKKITSYGYVIKNSGEFVLIESIRMAFQLFESYQQLKSKQEQLSLAMDAEDHAYWDWNIDTNETYFSPRYFEMLGFDSDDLPMNYQTWEYLLHPEDKEKLVPLISRKVAEKEPFEIEFRLRTKAGGWKWIRGKGKSYQLDEDGVPHRVVGTHEDISERKLIQQKWEESETRFRLIFENASIGIALVDDAGRPVMSNPAFQEMLGYTQAELQQLRFVEFTHPDDIDKDAAEYKRIYRNEINGYSLEKRYIRKDGSVFWALLEVSVVRNKDGNPIFAVGMVQDLTESRETEKKYRQLIEGAEEAITSIDPEGRLLVLNNAAAEILGGRPEDFIGKTIEEVLPPEEAQVRKKTIDEIIKSGTSQNMVTSVPIHNRTHWFKSKMQPVFNNKSEITAILNFDTDITQLKETEDEVVKREWKNHQLLDNAGMGISYWSCDGDLIMLNRLAAGNIGAPPENCIGKSIYELYDTDNADTYLQRIQKTANEKKPLSFEEDLVGTADGERWFSSEYTCIFDRDEEVLGVEIITHDITNLKRVESELKEKNAFLSSFIDNVPVIFYSFLVGLGGTIFSIQVEEILGIPRAELIAEPMRWHDSIHPDDIAAVDEAIGQCAAGSPINVVYRIQDKNLKWHWFRDIAKPRALQDDNTAIEGIALDITREMVTENALRESEANLRAVIENTNDLIVLRDTDGKVIEYNQAFADFIKRFCGFELHKGMDISALTGGNTPLLPKGVLGILKSGKPVKKQLSYTFTHDETRTYDILFNPIYNKGEVTGFSEISRDVTELREVERSLDESLIDLKLAQKISGIGNWQLDPDTRIPVWSDEVYEIYERDPKLGPPHLDEFSHFYEPDQYKVFKSSIENALYEGTPYNMRLKLQLPDGRVKWLHSICEPSYKKGDSGYFLRGTIQDITDHVENVTALRKAIEEKNTLMKELNHRVKNNLLMVESLIRLKDLSLGEVVDLSDLNHQIDAIRIIHETLYQSDQISIIQIRKYAQEILESVFSFSTQRIEIENKIGDFQLETRTAVSLGLIINELATNALKHGFNKDGPSRFSVHMNYDADTSEYILVIRNTGRPFPEHVDISNPPSLGLQLISNLTEQLNGTLTLEKKPIPVFTLRFPYHSNSDKFFVT